MLLRELRYLPHVAHLNGAVSVENHRVGIHDVKKEPFSHADRITEQWMRIAGPIDAHQREVPDGCAQRSRERLASHLL
jgi:hypothetical protein